MIYKELGDALTNYEKYKGKSPNHIRMTHEFMHELHNCLVALGMLTKQHNDFTTNSYDGIPIVITENVVRFEIV